MKRISFKNILALSAVLSLGACKKQLELNPYSSIELSQSFKTMKDAAAWNNGLYADIRGRVQGPYTYSQDIQGDQLNATLDYGNRNGFPHRWGIDFQATDGALSTAWGGFYGGLKNANLCIQYLPGIPTANATEASTLKKYIGDAYFARAFYYSELIIRFAKPYEPATAATDLGVPLVLVYNLNEQPGRASVKQVYDQILADIAQAKTMVTNNGGPGATILNKDVLLALEARVRLNMKDWAGAMTAANALITSGTYPLITTQAELTQMWQADLAKEVIFQSFVAKPSEFSNATGGIYLGFVSGNSTFDPDFVPTQAIINMYEAADRRKAAYFSTKATSISSVSYPSLLLVNKYPGNSALFTTSVTNYQHAPKIFRTAEQYLIYAEAAARAGGANEALALTTLNTLRSARAASALSGLTGTALLQAVMDERTRELAFEGFRLWDLKRWHLGFTRGTPQNLQPIQQGPNFNLLTIPADHYQFTWGIPTNDISANPNLIQNTGW